MQQVESDFDEDEFLDGVKGAAQQVLELYATQNWKALEGMVSQAVLNTMWGRHAELDLDHKLKVSEMELRNPSAKLLFTVLWNRSMIANLDKKRSEQPLPTGCTPYWMVVGVEIAGDLSVNLQKVPAAPARSDDEGDDDVNQWQRGRKATPALPLATGRRHRRGVWLFARGPLPKHAVAQLEPQWWLLQWLM